MKYAASMAMVILIVMAGAAAWAQSGCPQPTPCVQACPQACPQPCPKPCPDPCPEPCPPACPPAPCCPAAVPAAVGAGPAGDLDGLSCPDFDPAYAQKAYQHNATIIAVTKFGADRATDDNLRGISREINGRMLGANAKLAGAYEGCACLSADLARADAIIAELCNQSGDCFDVAYAKTLSTLVKQSETIDSMAGAQAVNSVMKEQGQFMTGIDNNWAFRLDRWVTDHGYTA